MSGLKFTDEHEWVSVDGDIATVGISDYAQGQLGDLVFVELPDIGQELTAGDEACVVESVKAASEIYAPVGGEVVEVNEDLNETPALVNEDAMDGGWFFKLKMTDPGEADTLKGQEEYDEYVESLS